jgi:hypothetical protein
VLTFPEPIYSVDAYGYWFIPRPTEPGDEARSYELCKLDARGCAQMACRSAELLRVQHPVADPKSVLSVHRDRDDGMKIRRPSPSKGTSARVKHNLV